MPQVIRIICYSNNKKEARERAEEILNDNLVGEDKPFDYSTFFDDNTSSVSGKSRWGNLPPVCLADSKEGKKLIDEGMKSTKDYFMTHIKDVRELIDFYSDEELFEEKIIDTKKKIIVELENKKDTSDLHMFKYYCNCLGQYRGHSIFVYDNDGEGIRNYQHLKDVLNKWGAKEYKGLKCYVIPCDCHY